MMRVSRAFHVRFTRVSRAFHVRFTCVSRAFHVVSRCVTVCHGGGVTVPAENIFIIFLENIFSRARENFVQTESPADEICSQGMF